MALTQRLEFRQSQSLVMTPQLMQAIKLLQLSNLDLSAFVEEELERNPLLERASDGSEPPVAGEGGAEGAEFSESSDSGSVYGDEASTEHSEMASSAADNFEPVPEEWIDRVDEAGYVPPDVGQAAERLGASQADVEAVLSVLQKFDPPGVCARSLSECLAIQLRELNRYDPAMQALVEHLDLLAKRDIASLRKFCGVDDEDITDMIGEIRRLDPKPGLKFGSAKMQTMVPDVYVRPGPARRWHAELNSDTLPRLLVNQTDSTEMSKTIRKDGDKSYFTDCLQNATWPVRPLDQRAPTLLKG